MRPSSVTQLTAQGRALSSMSQSAGTKVYALRQSAKAAQSSLSKLYEVVRAQEPHDGRAPTQQQVQEICSVIEHISLEDLGVNGALGQAMQYGTAISAREQRSRMRQRGTRGTVTYLDIHDDPTMTIGIFQLPPGSRMPLHDHPGMTVFSRLLYGTLHVRAYDWVDPNSSQQQSTSSTSSTNSSYSSSSGCSEHGVDHGTIRAARLVTDRVLTAPADTMVLFPRSGGNIHAFTAISPCAILDVLTPPYGNRNCTYYREVFPPQWIDAQGCPTIVPSEDVASWVSWQQTGRSSFHDAAPLGPDANNNSAGLPDGGLTNGGGGGGKFPGISGVQNGQGIGGEQVIVGLEVWKEPNDFHVARGLYNGQRVAAVSR